MDFIRFIGWMWNKNDDSDKFLFLFFFWFGICFIVTFLFGFDVALATFFIGLFVGFILYILYNFGILVKDQWKKFQSEREQEAQAIVDRLAGVEPEKSRGQEMLDMIRARRKTSP